ncbi:hypothetical protein [Acinetobacter baumannii]|uniref:hypothetical protein n=1 Tax=Acinetobacter baumannii TaxID=470 RepID=UPI0022B2D169|nr:hypothetical protein [Acinetobacter baumannii]
MSVPVQTPSKEYIANGTTTAFPLEFNCDKAEYLIITLNGEEAPVGSWTLTNDTVIFNVAPLNGVVVNLERNTPFQRTTNYQLYDNSFRPSAVNKDFDLIWWKLQELGYRDQVIWLALVKEISDRISGDDNLQNQINTIDEWLGNLQENVDQNTNDIEQLVNDLSKEIADRIKGDQILKDMFLSMIDEAINEGTINALAVTHVDSLEGLNAISNVWDGRTIYVKDLGNYRYDALTTSWVKAYQDADNVKDGIETQKQINDKNIQIVPSLEEVKNVRVRGDGQVIYMKSWHFGRKTGGHKWVFDSSSTATENDVTVVASRNTSTGRWLAVFEEEKVLPMSWGGVLADNATDNTEAVQRVFDVQQADWTVRFDNGTTLINGSPTVKAYAPRIKGCNKWSTVVKFPTVGNLRGFNFTSLGGTDFRDLTLAGSGVYNGMTLVYDDRQSIGIKIADVDISFLNCAFTSADTITKCFGRGVNFYDCFAFDIRTAWLDVDFPDPFQPGNSSNQTLETGFRGFIFKNNRSHYCPAVLMRNFGYNRSNIQGITIDNNELEGAGKIFAGVLRDAQITNNHSWMKDSGFKTFELIDAIDVLYSGNVNRATTGFYMGEFMTVNNSLKNVVISGNIFDGLNSDLVRVYGSNGMTDLKIFDNSYANLTTSACILNHSAGVLNNLYIKERLVAPSATWLPVKRAGSLSSEYRDIDIVASGSPYVHNFARNLNCRDMRKTGTYLGTGEAATTNIIVGYQANHIRVRGADGTTCILINGNTTMANGIAFTTDGFSATAAANKAQWYIWESE